jgi:DNA-binding CsgD family transcriptional regulator
MGLDSSSASSKSADIQREAALLLITPTERATLQWLAKGKGAIEIASGFGISEREVEVHLASLLMKMGVRTSVEAVAAALTRGLLSD